MIKACKQGKIDLILTKSISRFARNTVDALQYCRALRVLGIAVLFEKENINTLEMSDEIILTVLSMIAQSESESQSKNVAMGIRMGYKAGKAPFRGLLFGYKRGSSGEYLVVPEQAAIVQSIFDRYLNGGSTVEISAYLEEQHIPSPKGSPKWNPATIQSMLQNERYAGDVLLQKTFVQDCLSKRVVKNNGILPMYLVRNHHDPIIDRITFHRVQEEIARRRSKRKVSDRTQTEQSKYSGKYALTERLICGECNTPYRRVTWARNGTKRIVWRCINRLDHGTKYCKHSPTLEEGALHEAIVNAINANGMALCRLIPLAKRHLASALQNEAAAEQQRLREKITERKALRQEISKNCRTEEDFTRYEGQFQKISEEIRKLSALLAAEEEKSKADISRNSQLEEIMALAENGQFRMEQYDDLVIRRMIECITVNSPSSLTLRFKGGAEVQAEIPCHLPRT